MSCSWIKGDCVEVVENGDSDGDGDSGEEDVAATRDEIAFATMTAKCSTCVCV